MNERRIYQAADGEWIVSDGVEKRRFATAQEARITMRENEYISNVRTVNRQIWEGLNALKALQREWTALDYGTTLDEGTGDNAGITAAAVGAVVFDTANALDATLNAGHATNMARLL